VQVIVHLTYTLDGSENLAKRAREAGIGHHIHVSQSSDTRIDNRKIKALFPHGTCQTQIVKA
jgi:hypothetical protein